MGPAQIQLLQWSMQRARLPSNSYFGFHGFSLQKMVEFEQKVTILRIKRPDASPP
jgi:hypothetical protein